MNATRWLEIEDRKWILVDTIIGVEIEERRHTTTAPVVFFVMVNVMGANAVVLHMTRGDTAEEDALAYAEQVRSTIASLRAMPFE